MSVTNYLKETKAELAHVNWPTRRQSVVFSIVVIVISIFVAFYLGFFDYIFSKVLNFVIS